MHVLCQEETWQQASEPKEEPEPVPQADAEPAVAAKRQLLDSH